jgi:hypothetical protein
MNRLPALRSVAVLGLALAALGSALPVLEAPAIAQPSHAAPPPTVVKLAGRLEYVDARGRVRPAARAVVIAWDRSFGQRTTAADRHGNFELDLPAGDWRITITAEYGRRDYFWRRPAPVLGRPLVNGQPVPLVRLDVLLPRRR